jgi:hypothetical protein
VPLGIALGAIFLATGVGALVGLSILGGATALAVVSFASGASAFVLDFGACSGNRYACIAAGLGLLGLFSAAPEIALTQGGIEEGMAADAAKILSESGLAWALSALAVDVLAPFAPCAAP